MQTYIAFTYTSGQTGFVLTEALKTFQKKDEAVQTAMKLQTNKETIDHAELDKAMSIILSANRRTKRNGWFFLNKEYVDHLVSLGRATIVGA